MTAKKKEQESQEPKMKHLIKKTLTRLLLILELSDTNIVAILLFLQEEQMYQMMIWLHRMMGKDLDQKLTFQEVWLQAEKIKEMY